VDAYLAAHQAHIWLIQETNLVKATRWADVYRQSAPHATSYPEEFALLTLSQVELAEGRLDQIPARLGLLAQAAQSDRRNDSLIKIIVLQALVQTAQGTDVQAVDTLNRALDLGAPEGYCQTFLDKGPAIIRLLRQSHHPYAATLLHRVQSSASPSPTADLEKMLNEREIQVLRLFASGLSNTETAQEMFLSTNTIKWYAKNIYRKLNVNRRAQAIARARELGLIP
jgi:LuxR family maltose regulon positive regulatory protein